MYLQTLGNRSEHQSKRRRKGFVKGNAANLVLYNGLTQLPIKAVARTLVEQLLPKLFLRRFVSIAHVPSITS